MNEININVPEGMKIDRENSTFECIKFKPIKVVVNTMRDLIDNKIPISGWKLTDDNTAVKEAIKQ